MSCTHTYQYSIVTETLPAPVTSVIITKVVKESQPSLGRAARASSRPARQPLELPSWLHSPAASQLASQPQRPQRIIAPALAPKIHRGTAKLGARAVVLGGLWLSGCLPARPSRRGHGLNFHQFVSKSTKKGGSSQIHSIAVLSARDRARIPFSSLNTFYFSTFFCSFVLLFHFFYLYLHRVSSALYSEVGSYPQGSRRGDANYASSSPRP